MAAYLARASVTLERTVRSELTTGQGSFILWAISVERRPEV